jgi:hypothetical protein
MWSRVADVLLGAAWAMLAALSQSMKVRRRQNTDWRVRVNIVLFSDWGRFN